MSKKPKRRGSMDAAIVASLRYHEEAEPEISTERLMEMVRGTPVPMSTGASKRCSAPAC